MKNKLQIDAEVLRAYKVHETQVTQRHLMVGSLMVMLLMPAGVVLDYAVYPELVPLFFKLRLLSTVIATTVLIVLQFPASRQWQRLLGLLIAMLPVIFITWMIALTPENKGGPIESPYYAGLNLSLLAIAFVMRWSAQLSILTSGLTLLLYAATCFFVQPTAFQKGIFINNAFFLVLTAMIVTVGSWLHSTIRLREFAANYELDRNKQILEDSNRKLDDQNKELADAIQKLTEAESQLVQSEKMASLGRMSAGIIHEINNPLNFAKTGLFTLKKKAKHIALEQQEEYNEVLQDVEDGIERVKNIVSDLRTFTHPATDSLDNIEVTEVVTSALRFLSSEMKDKATIELKLLEHQLVRANKNKLIHVFVNLIQNSLDALKYKTFNNGERPAIWIEGRENETAGYLIVRDNGPGIPAEHVDKIFDPFYTTKDVGEGMGLGLSICYRIMQECQGKISVHTEVGKFCEITLEFPRSS